MSDSDNNQSAFSRFLDEYEGSIAFIGMAALVFSILQILYFQFYVGSYSFLGYLRFCAELSAGLLNLIGEDVSVIARTMTSATGEAVTVVEGCDALRIYSVLVAVIIAYEATAMQKLTGIIIGVGLMFLFNVVRISALLWIDIHYTELFDVFHHNLLPMGLWVIAVAYFYFWGVSVAPEPAASDS